MYPTNKDDERSANLRKEYLASPDPKTRYMKSAQLPDLVTRILT